MVSYTWAMQLNRKPLYVKNVIMTNITLEILELGDILNDRWTFVKLCLQENDFWAPDGDLLI